jgi:5-methylcytosine-specific restriction endonuclease McrA
VPARRKVPASARTPAARTRYARRRQNRLSRVDNDLTPDQWQALMEAWEGCAYCQNPAPALQRDCIMPISRGGRYTLENVVPACASCNASKNNSEVTSWLRRTKLDERSFLVRHATILKSLVPAAEDEGL